MSAKAKAKPKKKSGEKKREPSLSAKTRTSLPSVTGERAKRRPAPKRKASAKRKPAQRKPPAEPAPWRPPPGGPYLPQDETELVRLLRLLPGYDPFADCGDCVFDQRQAERYVAFFFEMLHHSKGEKGGMPFALEPWQAALVANLFGWVRPDGTRRYRECLIFIPRKNGKTPLAAGIVLAMLMLDHEQGPEMYSAAGSVEQADLLFQQIKGMIAAEAELASRLRVYKGVGQRQVSYESQNGFYKVLSSDAENKHGFNTHGVVIDELHVLRSRELVDVLVTSTAARAQPLVVHTTTAGYDRQTICHEKYAYACRVRDGLYSDPSFLPVIYEAGKDDDWTDPATWARANPNLGVSVKREYLERECKRAQDEPSYENTFKRLHLNIWTEQDIRWLSMARWAECAEVPGGPPVDRLGRIEESALLGRPCYCGVDLSSNQDITAVVYAFPWRLGQKMGERDKDGRRDADPTGQKPEESAIGGLVLLPRFYVPAERVVRRSEGDHLPYDAWARDGLLRTTEGDYVDQTVILADIEEDLARFGVRSIGVDRWGAAWLFAEMQKREWPFVDFRQDARNFDEPCKHLERLIGEGRLMHGGHPVLSWMAGNVTLESDREGRVRPSKRKSVEKIDGITAALMAVGRALVTTEGPPVDDDELYRLEVW